MEERTIRMKFGKAFTYIFDDPNWTSKLLAPVFITLIPVIGILVAVGYYLDLTRNVSRGEPYPLPNFDFGPQLARGFKWFVIQLIYGIPMVVLSVFLVPFIVDIVNKSDKGITATFSIFMVVALGLLILGIGLLISLIIPVAQANFANKDTIRSGLAFREIFRMLGNKFSAWLFVYLGFIIAGFIAPLGSAVVVVGVLITNAYGHLLTAYLLGEAYRVSETKVVQQVPVY
jgi:hypothetical protein